MRVLYYYSALILSPIGWSEWTSVFTHICLPVIMSFAIASALDGNDIQLLNRTLKCQMEENCSYLRKCVCDSPCILKIKLSEAMVFANHKCRPASCS